MSLTPRLDKLERNILINGGFDFWQRGGASTPVNTSTSLVYSAPDRWRVQHTGTFNGTPNVRRQASFPNNGIAYSLRHDFRRNGTAATLTYEQRIESVNCRVVVQEGFASFSMYVNAPIAGDIRLTVLNATALDNHTSQTTLYQNTKAVTAASWNLLEWAAIPVGAGGLNGVAVRIEYILASGTDGADQSFLMTGAMFNVGNVNSTFSRAGTTYDKELYFCQRYYEKSYDIDVAVGTSATTHNLTSGAALNGGIMWGNSVIFATDKRVSPTIGFYTYNGTANQWHYGSLGASETPTANIIAEGTSTKQFKTRITSGASGNSMYGNWTADAEI